MKKRRSVHTSLNRTAGAFLVPGIARENERQLALLYECSQSQATKLDRLFAAQSSGQQSAARRWSQINVNYLSIF